MSTYVRKTVRYVNETIGDTEARLVVEGDRISNSRIVNPHGTLPFTTFKQMQEAVSCLTEVIRRFNEEATIEYAGSKETEAISIDGLPRIGEDPLQGE